MAYASKRADGLTIVLDRSLIMSVTGGSFARCGGRAGLDSMMTSLLFAYGTLMPLDLQSAEEEGWSADAVRGRLYDLGPYPALVDLDDPAADWVEGFVRAVDRAELEGPLDSFEQVDEGLYRRVETITRNDRRVWVYLYARPVPADAMGPLNRWSGQRRARTLPPSAIDQGVL
jgi:gamma-glutamylcyclotransferase (GGCT)/AIG2-like uncharacterized protein YtfP